MKINGGNEEKIFERGRKMRRIVEKEEIWKLIGVKSEIEILGKNEKGEVEKIVKNSFGKEEIIIEWKIEMRKGKMEIMNDCEGEKKRVGKILIDEWENEIINGKIKRKKKEKILIKESYESEKKSKNKILRGNWIINNKVREERIKILNINE